MTGRVMELHNVLQPDMLATRITERWIEWDTLRQNAKVDWEEVRRYVYATDTTQTTNAQLPWKNKTTVPKLCQIRDNLFANYTATLFPSTQRNKWLAWQADEKNSASVDKRDAILNRMQWIIGQRSFKQELYKCIMDYIDTGNPFATIEFMDERVEQSNGIKVGYVGPVIKRINPLDIVFNPTAENFENSPKIVRSIISLGELREYLQRLSNDENRNAYEELYNYLRNIRFHARTFQGDWQQRDRLYAMDGFTSYRSYLLADFVEVLTFFGDWYDQINDHFEKNRVITCIDRHKLIENRPGSSYFAKPPIYSVPWRKRQDNLWGQGPLANLIGMQYRMDHVENMKADVFDLITYPVQKVKGFVEDFVWRPGEKIFIGDEGDVEMHIPPHNVLQANLEIQNLERLMEEMAGAPREAMGFRTPGEKTKYEVQRLENASARIYNNKITQFEEEFLEPLLNAMLELDRRTMTGVQTIPVFDDQFKITTYQELTVDDITGVGRIKPIAARHFAEQADLVQNITSLTGSNLWPTIQPHFSGVRLAQVFEKALNIEDYNIVMPFVALSEQAEAQKFTNALEEQVHMASQTATGQGSDFDLNGPPTTPEATPMNLHRQPPANATPVGTLATQ